MPTSRRQIHLNDAELMAIEAALAALISGKLSKVTEMERLLAQATLDHVRAVSQK